MILLTASLILIPFFRRQRVLITAWNLLLLGLLIFVGMGSIEAYFSPMRFPGLEWFSPSVGDVQWFMAANAIFLVTLLVAHRYDPLPPKVSNLLLSKWPPITVPVICYVMFACMMVMIAQILFSQGHVFCSGICESVAQGGSFCGSF